MANRWERCGLDAGTLEHVRRLMRMIHSQQRLMMQTRERGKSKEKNVPRKATGNGTQSTRGAGL